jgi:hypothetical protein
MQIHPMFVQLIATVALLHHLGAPISFTIGIG